MYTKEQVLDVLREFEQSELIALIDDTLLKHVPQRTIDAFMHNTLTTDAQCDDNVAMFVNKCRNLSSEGIYQLFEQDRDCIREDVFRYGVRVLKLNYEDEMEPTRATIVALGEMFNVKSMIEY